jgi:hypothetical protein
MRRRMNVAEFNFVGELHERSDRDARASGGPAQGYFSGSCIVGVAVAADTHVRYA